MTKIYKYRKLHGLEPHQALFGQIEICGERPPLSEMLRRANGNETVYLCGSLDQMTREYCEEPLSNGWNFLNSFVFKHRAPVYVQANRHYMGDRKEVAVKLISHREGWLPGCEDVTVAVDAWRALESEWKSTGLPLLSTPRATGIALLWENLPRGVEFPALPDDLARLIRANSPQHRIEVIGEGCKRMLAGESVLDPKFCDHQYDGRWMYASLCGLDRFPIGEPKRAEGFTPYTPGIYDMTIRIPETWAHVGLIPMLEDTGVGFTRAWRYPSEPGRTFRTWAFEPELTLALKKGWEIMDFHDGYRFEKGRPLMTWAHKLIGMRERLEHSETGWHFGGGEMVNHFSYARAAVRQVLNHSIGALHKNEYQREAFVSEDNYRKWRRENPHLAEGDDVLRVEGGYMVPTFVADTSPLSIFMPHWSATLYSLARARVAEWALKCEPGTLVKIHGDALYSTVAQPELDKLDDGETLGRPRRK